MSVTFTLFTASQDVLALNMLGGVDSFVAPFERVYGNIEDVMRDIEGIRADIEKRADIRFDHIRVALKMFDSEVAAYVLDKGVFHIHTYHRFDGRKLSLTPELTAQFTACLITQGAEVAGKQLERVFADIDADNAKKAPQEEAKPEQPAQDKAPEAKPEQKPESKSKFSWKTVGKVAGFTCAATAVFAAGFAVGLIHNRNK